MQNFLRLMRPMLRYRWTIGGIFGSSLMVALMWGLKYLPALFAEPPMPVFMLAFFGPVACVLLIVIWWIYRMVA